VALGIAEEGSRRGELPGGRGGRRRGRLCAGGNKQRLGTTAVLDSGLKAGGRLP
jgi:hypothetical protein